MTLHDQGASARHDQGASARHDQGASARHDQSAPTRGLAHEVRSFNWLLSNFVETTPGVTDAVAVSSDGLLMAMSSTLERAGAEQLAAIIAGMTSLGESTARCFALGGLDQVIVAMDEGFLFVAAVSDGSSLGVVADRRCDVGSVGYQMQLLVQRAGAALSPALVAELKESVLQ